MSEIINLEDVSVLTKADIKARFGGLRKAEFDALSSEQKAELIRKALIFLGSMLVNLSVEPEDL